MYTASSTSTLTIVLNINSLHFPVLFPPLYGFYPVILRLDITVFEHENINFRASSLCTWRCIIPSYSPHISARPADTHKACRKMRLLLIVRTRVAMTAHLSFRPYQPPCSTLLMIILPLATSWRGPTIQYTTFHSKLAEEVQVAGMKPGAIPLDRGRSAT